MLIQVHVQFTSKKEGHLSDARIDWEMKQILIVCHLCFTWTRTVNMKQPHFQLCTDHGVTTTWETSQCFMEFLVQVCLGSHHKIICKFHTWDLRCCIAASCKNSHAIKLNAYDGHQDLFSNITVKIPTMYILLFPVTI